MSGEVRVAHRGSRSLASRITFKTTSHVAELECLALVQLVSLWYCDRAGIVRIRHKAAQQAQELSKSHPFNLVNLQAAFSLITFLE